MTTSPIFGCEGICLSLGGRQILEDVSLSVSPGEILGLVGPNGAGKTSLFEVLSGRYEAQSGSVHFRDRDITRVRFPERARMGMKRAAPSTAFP